MAMDDCNELTIAQMVELEKLYKEKGEDALLPEFCHQIASTFSLSPNRIGKPAITWQQVHSWFLEMHEQTQPADSSTQSPMPLNCHIHLPLPHHNLRGAKAADLSELIFEAKSTRDYAWYDVGSFLNYRLLYSGELEVRVRFAGFDYTHDEWVNLKTGVRERSTPLEPSECHKVKVGDLVLCYREGYEEALYYDAHVVEIRRHQRDSDSCDCIFLVRYDHDNVEGKVGLEWICCRPAGETSQEIQLPPKSIFY